MRNQMVTRHAHHHAFILCFFHSVFDHLLKSRMLKPTASSSRHLASYPPRLTTYTPTYLHFIVDVVII